MSTHNLVLSRVARLAAVFRLDRFDGLVLLHDRHVLESENRRCRERESGCTHRFFDLFLRLLDDVATHGRGKRKQIVL
jgi:hypothetical protein